MNTRALLLLAIPSLVSLACKDGGGTTPPIGDTTPPVRIANLQVVSPAGRLVTLVWTSPTHEGTSGRASRYEIRRSATPLTEEGWASATIVAPPPVPKPAGEQELYEPTGLPDGTWHFAIKAADEVPNWSTLSNVVQATVADVVAPGRVSDLAISAMTATTLTLTWTAPGNDANVGQVVEYDLRRAADPITDEGWNDAVRVIGVPVPHSAGGRESFTVTGLQRESVYYFALKASDETPSWSPLSNVVRGSMVGLVRLTTTTGDHVGAYAPAWSPDGQTIAFSADWDSYIMAEIYTIPATGGPATQVTSDLNRSSYCPTWSPDGGRIAFGSTTGQTSEIRIMAAHPGATPTTLAMDHGAIAPAWSPDGTRIAYVQVDDANPTVREICTIPVGGGDPAPLLGGPGFNLEPAWSPDNAHIAFSSNRSGRREIWVIQVSGGDPVQLTDSPSSAAAGNPCWSPDGSRIAFASNRAVESRDESPASLTGKSTDNWEIWVIESGGGPPIQLTAETANCTNPSWSPDGHRIAFTRRSASGPSDIWILNLE